MVRDSNTTSYTCNINNQLLTEISPDVNITYAYDNNGSLVSKTDADDANNDATYTWDEQNRLMAVSEADGNTVYGYDGDGTRISKTQSGVKTKYINDIGLGLVQVLMETTDANTVQAVYTYGNDLISMNRADTNSFYHYDGMGSTRQLTGDSGTVVASYTYDSYGNKIASTGTSDNPYGFTGEQQFSEADSLVFLRARYYKPSIGMFISKDPIGYYDSMNLYTYVRNNPIVNIDPEGEVVVAAGMAAWTTGFAVTAIYKGYWCVKCLIKSNETARVAREAGQCASDEFFNCLSLCGGALGSALTSFAPWATRIFVTLRLGAYTAL